MASNRLIIDTDPGTDDVLAILLALTTAEVVLLSVTFGNVNVRQCLFNVLTLMFNLNDEVNWRRQQNLPVGFDGITKFRPRIAVGAEHALWNKGEVYDYFNGRDGLAETTMTHPQFNAPDEWVRLFDTQSTANGTYSTPFEPSTEPAHKAILRVLRENEPGTISLVALGPMTNFALAAMEDPETFLRAKELVTMGGAVDEPGNVTPVAEFNIFSDPVAAQIVYGFSSHLPGSTMPMLPPTINTTVKIPDYSSASFANPLEVVMMSLDITTFHLLTRGTFDSVAVPEAQQGSPLAQWLSTFMQVMFDKREDLSLGRSGANSSIELHDPLTTWYLLTQSTPGWNASRYSPEDIRPEPVGQWTTGMTVSDLRGQSRRANDSIVSSDRGNWLGATSGNRIYRMLESPGRDLAGPDLVRRLFAYNSTG